MVALGDEEIVKFAKELKIPLRAVVSKDQLPKMARCGAYVINMQSHNQGDKKGTHWTCFYLDVCCQKVAYFDSFGALPPQELYDWLDSIGKNHGVKWTVQVNKTDYQPIFSSYCGWYDLFFLYHYEQCGMDYQKVLDTFGLEPNELQQNDQIIKHFANEVTFRRYD